MGVGGAWGDREEFLHPRDSHGRFRNTWRMPQGAADAISKFLEGFSPKTFSSDAEAQSWIHNESRKNRLGTNQGSAITNFVKGFSNVNANLRAGKADPQAAQMLKGAAPLPNDLILTKTVEPSAFGLDPTHIANVEELTGKLIHDPGFTSANIGTPNPPTGPGPHIQMTIATPAGTKAIIPQVSSPTSEVVLTPDQNLRVTKVTPDGQGGYHMMVVATPGGTPKEKSTPLYETPPAPAPLNLPPKPGEQPATPGSAPAAPESPGQTPTPNAPSATAPPVTPVVSPATPSNAPSAPRSEPNVVEALTPGGTPTPAVQPTATPGTPEAPAAPEVPAGPVDFRQAVKDANIPSPTEGPRRKQWNNAYLGVVSGKKHPEDSLRELRADIEHNKGVLADDIKTNTDSGPLPGDIKAQEALANLIEEKYNLGKPKSEPSAEPSTSEEHLNRAREILSNPSTGENEQRAERLKAEEHIRRANQMQKAASRKETRARTPAPTAKEKARAEEARALGVKSGEEAAAKNAASDAAAKKISDPWLEKAGVKESDLTDHERVGVALMADSVARKKISRPEAARRLRGDGKNDKLARIADAISARPVKATPSAKVAKEAASQAPTAEGAIPEKATIAQLRQLAKDRGIKIPSKLTRKDDIRQHIEGGGESATTGKPSVEDRVATLLLDKIKQNDPKIADEIMQGMSPADRKGVEEAVARVKGAEEGIKAAGTGGAIPEKATIADLRKIAKDRGVKIPSKLTRKDDIRKHLEGASNPETAAVSRQGSINEARNFAEIAGELDHLLHNDASPAAMKSRVNAWAKRTGVPNSERDRLLKAVETGDKAKIDSELTRLRSNAGLTVVGGKRGEAVPFDRKLHFAPEGDVKPGQQVRVSQTGHEAKLPNGERVNVNKATVEPAGMGRGDIPEGADIETAIGHLDPQVVKDRKAIIDDVRKGLADPKKSIAQVGRDLDRAVSSIENSAAIRYGGHIGNPSDERKAELKVKLDQDRHDAAELKRLADHLKASRRAPEPKLSTETTPAKKAAPEAPIGVSSKDVKEGDAIVWQPPGETPVLGHVIRKGRFTYVKWSSGRERPLRATRKDPSLRKATEADVKELGGAEKATTKIEAPRELKEAVAKTSVADLRKQAADEGIKVPASARTKQQVMDFIVQEMAKRELARRGTARATEPRAAKVATPAQKQDVVDLMREKAVAKVAKAAEAPAKKAAPAKVAKKAEPEVKAPSARSIASRRIAEQTQAQQAAKAERTGVQAGKFSDKPILENHWGVPGGEINFHDHGVIGRALSRMGEDQKLEIDGQPLANVVGKLATEGVRGQKSSKEVVAELSKIRDRMPEGSKARSELDQAVKDLSAPERKIDIPSGTPKPLQDLAKTLQGIPVATRTHDEFGRPERIESELTLLAQIMDRYSKGELSGMRLRDQIENLHNRRHESTEGKFEIDRAVRKAIQELNAIGLRNLNPPKTGD